jgi:hypothetical protein
MFMALLAFYGWIFPKEQDYKIYYLKQHKQNNMGTSGIFTINWADFGKGIIVAIITAFLATIEGIVDAGGLPSLSELKTALIIGGTAGVAYIIKNLLTGSSGVFLKK